MKRHFILLSIALLILAGCACEGEKSAPSTGTKKAGVAKPLDLGNAKVSAVPPDIMKKYNLDPNFYKKYLDIGGVPVTGSDKVRDEAFYEARYLASNMLANRKDILNEMAKRGTRLLIIAFEEEVSEVPDYYIADPVKAQAQNRRVRGYGRATLTSFGEENLLTYPGDRYSRENIMIHEFAHCVDSTLRRMDPTWGRELTATYKDARSRGLWERTYSATNERGGEYWTEGVQAYFDCCARSRTGQPDGVHNHVGNREELKEYDPNLFKFIDKTLGPQEWRYTRYDARYPDRPVDARGVGSSRPDPNAARGRRGVDANSMGRRGRGIDANSTGRRGRRGADANQPRGTTTSTTAPQETPLDLGNAKVISPIPQSVIDKFYQLSKTNRQIRPIDANYYKKYLDVAGITLTGSERVADEAFYEARYLISHALAKRKDVVDSMAKANTRLILIAYEDEVSIVPEYFRSDPDAAAYQNWRVRGYGGFYVSSFAEENLLCFPGDRYNQENILIHEFVGHCADSHLGRLDPNFRRELSATFNDARSRKLWENTYSSNTGEYWSEGVQAYFDCCKRSVDGKPDGVHNHVGNRKELLEYDPNLYKLIDKTLNHIEWRYTKYNVRHPEGPVETTGVIRRSEDQFRGEGARGRRGAADANSAARRGRTMDANSMGRRGRGRRGTDANQPRGTTTASTTLQTQSPYFEENLMPPPSAESGATRGRAIDVNSAARRGRAFDPNAAGRRGRRGARGIERGPNKSTENLPRGVVISPIPQVVFDSYDFNDLDSTTFYKKMICAGGVPIVSSANVSDRAHLRAYELFTKLLAGRPDAVKRMVERRTRLCIIGADENYTDLPENRTSNAASAAYTNERVRGTGGNPTSFGEENVLCLPIDNYDDESIMIHEFGGHTLDGIFRSLDPNFSVRVRQHYDDAVKNGRYYLTYAGSNAGEYWAESVQNHFNCNRRNNWNHTFVRTREEMEEYDPNMAKFVKEVFNLSPEQDWRYEPLAKQPLITTPPAKLKTYPLYSKFLNCRRLPILGSKNANDDAMYKANELIRNMFTFRHDILKTMMDQGLQFIVLGDNERISDLPEFKGQKISGRIYFNFTKDNPRFVVGAEYLLTPDKIGENLVVREFAKSIPLLVGTRPYVVLRGQRQQYEMYNIVRIDETFNKKLTELYNNAIAKGLWKGTPAAARMEDYWAEGSQSWFDCNGKCIDASGKPINTRNELQKYDPDLAALCLETYMHPKHENFDWRAPLVVKKN